MDQIVTDEINQVTVHTAASGYSAPAGHSSCYGDDSGAGGPCKPACRSNRLPQVPVTVTGSESRLSEPKLARSGLENTIQVISVTVIIMIG